MRLSAAIIVLAAGAIARAQLSNIPQCSLTCFTSTLSGDGCSELTDFACHCQKPGLAADIVPCINKACDVTDRQAVSSLVVSLCSGVGHPVSISGVDTSAPTTTAVAAIPTTATSSNSTTVSSYGSGFKTSSTISAISAQSTSQFNGASSIAPGAVQMVGGAVLLAGMTFFI
ncbi:Extracellular membrane protein, CFEM domain, fungi [Penicillium expansum]|uniref:Extracellular membrane protein, CFEM domain, fungi n=1 Tax=Penicillium expansum TaxID=27334 RepID=A0A0A2KSX3_PENEN|nr:Extracellular membrane protein, CFEM domain, fungi [Penicillium expansum]KGO46512.1 Extracellular membrane protein, CFEM domain, fungi [Penicillium expansum]KGO50267.1 Extracellular membrane protein, CFEM domain, fungi [Penicillium expansum]KGO70869.1 Extracellular membrane protein, CFEM domain, fungi [Penicillium expansum]